MLLGHHHQPTRSDNGGGQTEGRDINANSLRLLVSSNQKQAPKAGRVEATRRLQPRVGPVNNSGELGEGALGGAQHLSFGVEPDVSPVSRGEGPHKNFFFF